MSANFRRFISCCLLVAATFATRVSAQTPAAPQSTSPDAAPKSDPDLEQAVELREAGKMVQAMPLLEKLCSEYPKRRPLGRMGSYYA